MSYKKETCACCGHTHTVDKVTAKTAKTIKDYYVKDLFGYGPVTVPAGSLVGNHTACGNDDNYRFWLDFKKTATEVSGGFKDSLLHHDLTFKGLNIPAEYCEPYPIER